MAIGQPEAMNFIWGGATSSGGPATGIYRVVVAEASLGMSKGDESKGKPQRPFVELEFHGKGDSEHPAQNGKKVIKQRFYSPLPSDDKEKQKMMAGMLKRSLSDGLGVKWSPESKSLDPRIFVKKECFIAIGPGKPSDTGETRQEVQAIALQKEKLPKKFLDGTSKKEEGEESDAPAADEKPARRR